jgi:hypothetical protein
MAVALDGRVIILAQARGKFIKKKRKLLGK